VAIAGKWLSLAALSLAACAPTQWTKADASAEQLAADKRACENDAYREVQKRQQKSAGTMGPAVVGGPTGSQARRFNTTPQGPFADQRGTQLSDEEHLVAECMEAKGYAKVKK
jgi:outer membrane lipoprotein SlyB